MPMRRILRYRWRPLAVLSGLALLLALLAGCGNRTAKVSGKVTYMDKPVRGGTVMFQPVQPGREIATATLDEEGRYELTVAVGEVLVLVDNRELAPREKASLPDDLKLPKGIKPDSKPAEGGQQSVPPASA